MAVFAALPKTSYASYAAAPPSSSRISDRQAPGALQFGCGPDASHSTTERRADASGTPRRENALQRLCRRMIEWYQGNRFIHNKLYKWINLRCPFPEYGYSSCSQYTKEAIERRGAIKGMFLGLGRILSCNPMTVKALEKGTARRFLEA